MKISIGVIYKHLLSTNEFNKNCLSGNHTLLMDVNEYLFVFPYFLT